MFPAKPLVCGVAAVGSVSTAAVVANQYGLFSTSNKEQKTNATPSAETTDSETTATKIKKEEIKKWLAGDSETTDWTIKIKKDGESKDFKDPLIKEEDLDGLKDYLSASERETILKDLFSSLETLIFDKKSDGWKHILTKADIEKWVDKTSQSKATLKVSERDSEKTDFSEDESIDIFKTVYGKKDIFTSSSVVAGGSKKTILFEKIDSNWKHSKTEIDNWLKNPGEGDNKFEIKINDDATTLDSTDEGKLIGLFKYLKDGNVKSYNPSGKKSILTLKKDNNNWIVAGSQTIN